MTKASLPGGSETENNFAEKRSSMVAFIHLIHASVIIWMLSVDLIVVLFFVICCDLCHLGKYFGPYSSHVHNRHTLNQN